MPKQELRTRLADLHAELGKTSSVDAESRRLLEEVLHDIQGVLEPQSGSSEPETLSERLRDATHSFEESHPTLYTVVGRVVDALANMGI